MNKRILSLAAIVMIGSTAPLFSMIHDSPHILSFWNRSSAPVAVTSAAVVEAPVAQSTFVAKPALRAVDVTASTPSRFSGAMATAGTFVSGNRKPLMIGAGILAAAGLSFGGYKLYQKRKMNTLVIDLLNTRYSLTTQTKGSLEDKGSANDAQLKERQVQLPKIKEEVAQAFAAKDGKKLKELQEEVAKAKKTAAEALLKKQTDAKQAASAQPNATAVTTATVKQAPVSKAESRLAKVKPTFASDKVKCAKSNKRLAVAGIVTAAAVTATVFAYKKGAFTGWTMPKWFAKPSWLRMPSFSRSK